MLCQKEPSLGALVPNVKYAFHQSPSFSGSDLGKNLAQAELVVGSILAFVKHRRSFKSTKLLLDFGDAGVEHHITLSTKHSDGLVVVLFLC